MNAQFEWREEFNLGVEEIDKEHQRLFKIINKISAIREEEKNSQWACQEGIKYFKSHTVKHFADEEAYMASIGYEGLEQHRRIHQGFRTYTLPALERELEQANYSDETVDHFLGVCAGWLIGHTLTEDLSIVGKRRGTWENLLPDEQLAAMKELIIQLVFDMFRLESHLVSDTYSGEKFGNGVYYRLIYGKGQEEERLEVIMVFEESLLVKTVGRAMGLQTNKLDALLIHAARYTARQFAGRITEHLPASEEYELKEENLLSFEQFQKIFQRKKIQASLLFDTGEGYFAYCVIAPHLLESGVAAPIQAENVLSEVEKYLNQREEEETLEEQNPKRKILVVDDSQTIRQGMKNLLDPDYEVTLAESGAAAIRTITLNRPDLVLLDYEMPVCNGKQTLEMLRSEQSFTDIPVIFLTGQDDPGIVKTLLSLRPAGYLLKYLKPQELKKKIDAFFSNTQAAAKACNNGAL